MQFKQKIADFMNRTFHDEIIVVRPIEEYWVNYRDVGMRLEFYFVPVVYKYRGERKVFFTIDNDHLGLVTQTGALKQAQNFYEKTLKKIQERNEKTK